MDRNTIDKKPIVAVEINQFFADFSFEFGYEATEYAEEIIELQTLWESQKFIEVYRNDIDRRYGRAKPSDEDVSAGTIPHLIGLYHVRLLQKGNDPLIILTFEKAVTADDSEEGEIAVMRFMLSHDDIFGELKDKKWPERLKKIKSYVSRLIEQGNKS